MIVTTEMRIKDKAFADYLEERAAEESKIIVYAINRMKRADFGERWQNKSKFNTHLCEKFGILSRTANSIINYAEGAIKSYIETKKFELEDKKLKLESALEKLKSRKEERGKLKKKAAENALTKRQKKRLKRLNQSIYHLNNRINRIRQRIKTLKRMIKNREVHISFGGKKLFKKQFHLQENGYKKHEEWKKDFRAQRARMVFSVGRAAEKGGNQTVCFCINPDNGTLTLRYRKEHVKKGEQRYLYCRNMVLSYLKEPFYEILRNPGSQAVCARFLKRRDKWFVQIIFDMPTAPVLTSNEGGVCSLDYNDGFIQLGELDEHANLTRLEKYDLRFHGTGNRATNEIREKIKEIVLEAKERGKSIACEELWFFQTRARCSKHSLYPKSLRKTVSVFDFRRYLETLERCCKKNGVQLIKVNPSYTSVNAKEWYCPNRKLSVHQGACINIGRRAMGLSDFGPNQLT